MVPRKHENEPARSGRSPITDVVIEGEGGNTTVSARLICNPINTNEYYVDTRNAEGKLVIGRQIEYT